MIYCGVSLLMFSLTALEVLPARMRQTNISDIHAAVINEYPSTVALLYTSDGKIYQQACVGTVLTTKTIITAGHCLEGDSITKWRARIGSSWANKGGAIYNLTTMLIHPNFNVRTMDSDVALVYTIAPIVYKDIIKPGYIAGANYNPPNNQVVWAVGFGHKIDGKSGQLRSIKIWTVNQNTCAYRYSTLGSNITANMLCAGSNSTSGAQCAGDSGGPLFHNGVLIGIYSWGFSCANSLYPGINSRISRFTTWIQTNAL